MIGEECKITGWRRARCSRAAVATATEKRRSRSLDSGGKRASLWECGEAVLVRANKYQWLPGRVKRIARGGVVVWVEEAKVAVHVPFPLVTTHLCSSSLVAPPPGLESSPCVLRLPGRRSGCSVVLSVRPAHLSHRVLLDAGNVTACGIEVNPCTTIFASLAGVEASPTALAVHAPMAVPTDSPLQASSARLISNHPERPQGGPSEAIHSSPPAGENPRGLTIDDAASLPSPHEKTIQNSCNIVSTPRLPETILKTSNWNENQIPDFPAIASTSTPAHPTLELPLSYPDSSASSSPTTPSPSRQSLVDRLKKLRLPSSEKTSPKDITCNTESSQSSASTTSNWITVIRDGVQAKSR